LGRCRNNLEQAKGTDLGVESGRKELRPPRSRLEKKVNVTRNPAGKAWLGGLPLRGVGKKKGKNERRKTLKGRVCDKSSGRGGNVLPRGKILMGGTIVRHVVKIEKTRTKSKKEGRLYNRNEQNVQR